VLARLFETYMAEPRQIPAHVLARVLLDLPGDLLLRPARLDARGDVLEGGVAAAPRLLAELGELGEQGGGGGTGGGDGGRRRGAARREDYR